MDIVPIVVATGSTIFASINTLLLRRQSNKLKLMKERHKFSIDETRKCIREKDDIITDIYALHEEANTLYALMRNNLNYFHIPTRDHPLYNYKIHIHTNQNHNDSEDEFNPMFQTCNEDYMHYANISQKFIMCCSTNNTVYDIVHNIVKLLQCFQRIKANRCALHAIYTSNLHQTIEKMNFFLHTPTNAFVHIPLTMQHKMTTEMTKLQQQDTPFQEHLQQWVGWLVVGYTQPIVQNMKSNHNYFIELLPKHSQKNLLCNALFSDTIGEYTAHNKQLCSPPATQNEMTSHIHNDIVSSFLNKGHYDGVVQSAYTLQPKGVHLIQQCKQYDAFSVLDIDTAKLFIDRNASICFFFQPIQHVHSVLNRLYTFKQELQQNFDNFKGIIIHCVVSAIGKHKRTYMRHKKILKKMKLKYPYDPLSKSHSNMYSVLKTKIKSNRKLLKDTQTLLKKKTLCMSNEDTLFDIYKPVLFSCFIDVCIPCVNQFLDILTLLIDETNHMIQKDITFRNSIIDCR